MKMSPQGLAALAQFEGLRTEAYRDSVGVWTIGVGHTAMAGPPKPVAGMRITRQEALEILARDLPQYESAVAKRMPNVPQHVFDGAVSFCFNLGAGAFGKATWVAKYLAGNAAGAENSFKTWDHAGGRVLAGLTTRRRLEADIIFRGRYPAGIAVVPQPATHDTPVIEPGPTPIIVFDPRPPDDPGPQPVPASPSPADSGGFFVRFINAVIAAFSKGN